ncbi:MAG TPA: DegT/DnrJ/EryC1/StrS family aminotransferase [Acidimicrobiia bacterium]
MISVSALSLGDREQELVLEVLRSGRLVRGPMVVRFEAAVAAVTGTRHAVAVNNGTSALIAALMAHEIGPGDEVITAPFTFVATLNAILHTGATPRFADIGDDFNLDPDAVERAVTPRTRAVLPVHLYGCPAPMTELARVASRHDLVVVEDGAQALGAHVDDRPVGGFGTGCFSFYATKNVTTGEGGAVTTDDDVVADRLRVLRDQGQRGPYEYERPGFNLRMTELEAAIGVAQLGRLDDLLDARRRHARHLHDGLAGIRGLVVPHEPAGRHHVYHQFTVRVTDEAPCTRDEVSDLLHDQGVESRVFYPRPVFDYACFRADTRIGTPCTPAAERAGREVLSLPVHPALTERDLDHIVAAVRKVLT